MELQLTNSLLSHIRDHLSKHKEILRRKWRLSPESNRGPRLCRPLHNHSATQPRGTTLKRPKETESFKVKNPGIACSGFFKIGAGNEIRTRDPNLGKVVLYQLSYSRLGGRYCNGLTFRVKGKNHTLPFFQF